MRRVVITGMGGITSLGEEWPVIRARMAKGESGVRTMHEWDRFQSINTRLAAPVGRTRLEGRYPRKKPGQWGLCPSWPSMPPSERLTDARAYHPSSGRGRSGIAYGSSFGSFEPVIAFGETDGKGHDEEPERHQLSADDEPYSRREHRLFFGITGRIIPTSTACTSGSLAIGYAYEAIANGHAGRHVGGGADELSAAEAAVFDTLYATSDPQRCVRTLPRVLSTGSRRSRHRRRGRHADC